MPEGTIDGSINCNATTGQCRYKLNLMHCNKILHFTLLTDCGCVPEGTIDGSINCNATTGQCRCKLNVMHSECSECKDEYHSLSNDNEAGKIDL